MEKKQGLVMKEKSNIMRTTENQGLLVNILKKFNEDRGSSLRGRGTK